MGMSLELGPRLRLARECSVCGALMPEVMTLREKLLLSGSAPGAVDRFCIEHGICLLCGRDLDPVRDDPLPADLIARYLKLIGVRADGTKLCPPKAVGLPFDLVEVP